MVGGGVLTAERTAEWGSHERRLVERGQLLAKLDRAVTRKVTVISAPAGSGKTSLLRAWADRPLQTHRVAFVTVRREQRDEQLFWLALLQAVRETVAEEAIAFAERHGCIYAKLDARDRSAAVERARELRLLSSASGR